jgi:hypothetical protein
MPPGLYGLGMASGGVPQRPTIGPSAPALMGPQINDPQSQYLAAALSSMQQKPPQSGTALGLDLLASALDNYGLAQRGQRLAAQQYGQSPGAIQNTYANDPLANPFGGQ